MRGTGGKFDRVKMVEYTLQNRDQDDRIDFGNNCTNFVSQALVHAGMQKEFGRDLGLRLTRRIAEIHDGRLALRAYRDSSIEAMAAVRAREAGLPAEEAEAVTEAAVLAAAMELKHRNVHPTSHPADLAPVGETLPLRRPDLVRIAHALDRSPIVAEAVRSCRSAGKQEDSVHGSAE
ncbi:hypothetical protein ADK86_06060 [Streptomyces sp. NRRL F-5755]|uniref:DUF6545 domain-containing protein n=1 Tax=Streptomyces sp. NRRL F-5755 TaxID=1519475 RepID=UPI0006AE583D|nr:DUF6545 domain-containing protein [Streptomyces sp. NRRL F-5755]KOU06475.1 hypothetical protein ADK86_06060 [Streptomyces sp. NRRL F-5755]